MAKMDVIKDFWLIDGEEGGQGCLLMEGLRFLHG
jgi:hypothetical protein